MNPVAALGGLAQLIDMGIRIALEAKSHRHNCKAMAQRLETLKPLVLEVTEIQRAMTHDEVRAFDNLKEAIERCVEVLRKCKEASRTYMVFRGMSIIQRFKDSSTELDRCLNALPLVQLRMSDRIRGEVHDVSIQLRQAKYSVDEIDRQLSNGIGELLKEQHEGMDANQDLLCQIAQHLETTTPGGVRTEVEALRRERELARREKETQEEAFIVQIMEMLSRMESQKVVVEAEEFPPGPSGGDDTSGRQLPEPPAEFFCPISQQLMHDPVLVESGQTYDRKSIVNWFRTGHATCPISHMELPTQRLTRNINLRDCIVRWCSEHSLPPPPEPNLPEPLDPFTNGPLPPWPDDPPDPLDEGGSPSSAKIRPPNGDWQNGQSGMPSSSEVCAPLANGWPKGGTYVANGLKPPEEKGRDNKRLADSVVPNHIRTLSSSSPQSTSPPPDTFPPEKPRYLQKATAGASIAAGKGNAATGLGSPAGLPSSSQGLPPRSPHRSPIAQFQGSPGRSPLSQRSQPTSPLSEHESPLVPELQRPAGPHGSPGRIPLAPSNTNREVDDVRHCRTSQGATEALASTAGGRDASDVTGTAAEGGGAHGFLVRSASEGVWGPEGPGRGGGVENDLRRLQSDVALRVRKPDRGVQGIIAGVKGVDWVARAQPWCTYPESRSPRNEPGLTAEPERRALALAEELGVPPLVVSLWSNDPVEVREAARELRRLAKLCDENRAAIGAAGAIQPLVGLLTSGHPEIQEHAVTAILNISIHESNKVVIVAAGAIRPLVEVLAHLNNSVACENAAAALFSLSMTDESRVTIGQAGAIPRLVELYRNGRLTARQDALRALYNLSICSPNKPRIVRAGLVPLLLELATDAGLAAQASPSPTRDLYERGMQLLSILCQSPEGRAAIGGSQQGIAVLVGALESGTPRAQESSVAALLLLCKHSKEYARVIGAEAEIVSLLVDIELSQDGAATKRARDKAAELLRELRVTSM